MMVFPDKAVPVFVKVTVTVDTSGVVPVDMTLGLADNFRVVAKPEGLKGVFIFIAGDL
jgi:hypothetical protein